MNNLLVATYPRKPRIRPLNGAIRAVQDDRLVLVEPRVQMFCRWMKRSEHGALVFESRYSRARILNQSPILSFVHHIEWECGFGLLCRRSIVSSVAYVFMWRLVTIVLHLIRESWFLTITWEQAHIFLTIDMFMLDAVGTSWLLPVIYFYPNVKRILRALPLIAALAIIHRVLSWVHLDWT